MLRLLVISVLWADSPDNVWPISDVVARFQTVAAWYAEASYGRLTLVPTVAPFVRATTTSANANADTLLHISSDLGGPLKASGFDTTKFDRIIYIVPRIASVGPKGFTFGSSMVLNCGGSDYVTFGAIHELGHSLGLAHAQSLRVGGRNGKVMTSALIPPTRRTRCPMRKSGLISARMTNRNSDGSRRQSGTARARPTN